MFTRRMLPVSILLTLVLTLMMTASVSAQEVDDLGGSAVFRDAGAASDSLVMDFSAVPALSAGSAYEGWLIDPNGVKVSVGILGRSATSDIEETYVSPSGDNLVGTYNRFAISVEPVPDPDPETPGPIAYSDAIPLAAFAHIGHLLANWPPNPDGKGIAVGLREQMAVALVHAELAKSSSTLAAQQQHSQHVINIIGGSGGANYDASVGDPGDGQGVLNYAADLITHAGLAKGAAPDDESVGDGADDAIEAAEAAVVSAQRASDEALLVVTPGTSDFRIGIALSNQVTLAGAGVENAEAAYLASQDMALFEGTAGERPPEVGDALIPTVAMAALLAGLLLTGTGGLLLFRRRRTA